MSVTITNETTLATVEPLLITPWETDQASGSIVRGVVSGGEPYVTLGSAARRAGEFQALFDDETAAENARATLGAAGTFTIDYPERPSIDAMRFIVVDNIRVQLRRPRYWLVVFGFQEVAP